MTRVIGFVALSIALLCGLSSDSHASWRLLGQGGKQNRRNIEDKVIKNKITQPTPQSRLQFKQVESQNPVRKLPSAKVVMNSIQKLGRYANLKVKQIHSYLSTYKVQSIWKRIPAPRNLLSIIGGSKSNTSVSSLKYAIINNVPGDRNMAPRRIFAF
jgi:hypothetical protein